MAATTPTVLTVSGTPTNFLPLVTPYSAPTSCSNYIYKQEGPTYLAFDPYYGLNIDTDAATCLPSQVSTWWSQASDAVTTTVLGNSFNCPSLYRTVASSTASGFEHIYCCPSGYDAYILWPETPGDFAEQCTSQATPGGGFSYMSLVYGTDGQWTSSTTTSTSLSSTITVWGIPVNGYNKLDATATGTSSGSGATEAGATTTGASGSSSNTSAAASSGGLSSGASIGIGVGVGVGGVLALPGAFAFFWRKRRRSQKPKAADEYEAVPSMAQNGGHCPPSNSQYAPDNGQYAPNKGFVSPMTTVSTPATELSGDGKYASGNTNIYEAPTEREHHVAELYSGP